VIAIAKTPEYKKRWDKENMIYIHVGLHKVKDAAILEAIDASLPKQPQIKRLLIKGIEAMKNNENI
jgi:hypothetical protein